MSLFKNEVLAAPQAPSKSGLGLFIKSNMNEIIQEWSRFAKTRTPASNNMTALALRDHIAEILEFILSDMESPQTLREQADKSHGDGPKESGIQHSAAEIHAALRLSDGFDIDQMVSEYRALRASVIKLWLAKNQNVTFADFEELTRFNEAVDQTMTESISYYSKSIEQTRNLFLAILGHDLRNPIGAAGQLAELMVKRGTLDEKQSMYAAQIANGAKRAMKIIADLLDLARTSFGSELPIKKTTFDIGALAQQIIDEMDAFYPGHDIVLKLSGDMQVNLDKDRMGQIFSNLIGNAIHHGFQGTPIKVELLTTPAETVIRVHNLGVPIPADQACVIFESLVRGSEMSSNGSANLGLGLYITKKIVLAHGGSIDVVSDNDGTEFIVRLLNN